MKNQDQFEHRKLGKQMWHFVSPPPLKPQDVSGFEDGLPEVCLKKIQNLLPRCQELKRQRNNRIDQIRKLNKPKSLEEYFLKIWAAAEYSEYFLIKKWLTYWTRLWRIVMNEVVPRRMGIGSKGVTESEVERARNGDIEPYYEGELRRFGNRLMGLCPFHEERTPSFCIYLEGKGYHCFGCQAHGDAIDFVMKTQDLSFVEAVRRLI